MEREIWLIGEPMDGHLANESRERIDPQTLDISPEAARLLAEWSRLVDADAEDEEHAIVVGLRAASEIALSLEYKTPVFFQISIPDGPGWFVVQVLQ